MTTLKEAEMEKNQDKNWNRNKKKNRDSSPKDDFPANVIEYGDELYNLDRTP